MSQLLSFLDAQFAWYQIGSEERDPVLFFKTLLAALHHRLPGFHSPLLEEIIAKQEISVLDQEMYARLLMADLESSLARDFYLVFDDVHLLSGHEESCRFLGNIFCYAGSRIRFVLLSRQPIQAMIPGDWQEDAVSVVNNIDLAFSKREVAELYSATMGFVVDSSLVAQLHSYTEGWVMGLVLAGELFADNSHINKSSRLDKLLADPHYDILEYFRQETILNLPDSLRKSLVALSLLESVPKELAEQLAEFFGASSILEQISSRNFFIRSLSKEHDEYVFHHLFRDCLRRQALSEFNTHERQQLYCQSASWFVAHRREEEALSCFLQGADHDSAHDVLAKICTALVSDNRIQTLKQIYEMLPDEVCLSYPWFSFLAGVVGVDSFPARALLYFHKAMELFADQQDAFGELLAMGQVINFHLLLDGRFDQGRPLLLRAESLFDKLAPEMPVANFIQAGHLLGAGNTFFAGDLQKADHYSSMALVRAQEAGMDNFIVALRVNRCYQKGSVGKWPTYREEIEAALPLMNSPRVSAIHKMFLWLAMVNLLEMEGDFDNYEYWKTKFPSSIPSLLFAQSIAAPFLMIWDIDTLVAQGKYEDAMAIVKKGIASGYAGANAHLRSQFLQYSAFLSAVDGVREDAVLAAEEALRLRNEVGGKFFLILTPMILGGAYALLGMTDEAEKLLATALSRSQAFGEEFLRTGVYVHRAYARLAGGTEEKAEEDIRAALLCLKKNGYTHYFCWSPMVMEKILSVAVRENIERQFAQQLAKKCLGKVLLPKGDAIPLLQVQVLGGFSMSIPEAGTVDDVDLTAKMRELLSLLIASPQLRITLEDAQLFLWPDIDSGVPSEDDFFAKNRSISKTRSKLDNLTNRLRKVLAAAFKPYAVKNYFVVEKGFLRLCHCVVDAFQFEQLAEQGLVLYRRGKFWQAGNVFSSAFRCWNGDFFAGQASHDLALKTQRRLQRLCVESVLAWQDILVKMELVDEAKRILKLALDYDPVNMNLVRSLYDLYAQGGDVMKSRQLLKYYEQSLRKEGFASEEIEHFLEDLWSTAPSL
ncbi:MAG: hypothetical protein OEL66_00665 [Desulfobulbaceae bacterium]|nr:hypothetical protein [Desulfobulbaceae bacterium]